jgi:hypothetical protein
VIRLIGRAVALVAALGCVAADVPADATDARSQALTVYVRGADAQTTISASRPDLGTITLSDPGIGLVQGTFVGTPVRFTQLELLATVRGSTFPVYDGLVVLSDAREDTIAFQFDGHRARRIPIAPSARIDIALDERVNWWIAFGWGALALAWAGLLGTLWTLRQR